MRTIILSTILACICLTAKVQGITPPAPGKAVVYFARFSGLGPIVDFTFFDSNRVIGRFNSKNFMRYECAPGEHLFWASSENKDFITADLEAGKIYLVEADPEMGAFQAQVRLLPVDPKSSKHLEKVVDLINERTPRVMTEAELERSTNNLQKTITKALEKYHQDVAKGRKYKRLEKTMAYEKAN